MGRRRKLDFSRRCGPALQRKIAIIAFCLFILSWSNAFADSLPAAADINNLAADSRKCVDDFYAQTFESRFGIEFVPALFTEDDKQQLNHKVSAAIDRLADIEQRQRQLLGRIEDYDSNDWEARYGSTGLWRRLKAEIYNTALSGCEVGIFRAFLSEGGQRNEILHQILDSLNELEGDFESARLEFDRAKVYSSLSADDLFYRALAKSQLDKLLGRSDIEKCAALKIRVEQTKLEGQADINKLKSLSGQLTQGACGGDIEPVLSLGFLFRNAGVLQAYEETIEEGQAELFLGDFFLRRLLSVVKRGRNTAEVIEYINVFEAELAAKSAQRADVKEYRSVLEVLISAEKFRRPLILYAAAQAFADEQPERAIELLIDAAMIKKADSTDSFTMEAEVIARQAVNLAYEKYLQKKIDCNCVMKAFDDYKSIAGEITDEQLLYCYIYVLQNCNQRERAAILLRALAAEGEGYWSKRAGLDLIEQQIEQSKLQESTVPVELTDRLENFIKTIDANEVNLNRLQNRAVKLYCELMLERSEVGCLQRVVDILTGERLIRDPNLYVFKAIALSKLEKPGASAGCFLEAFKSNKCGYIPQASEFLSKFVEKIDVYEVEDKNFGQTAEDCRNLAGLCCGCLEGAQKEKGLLLLAEISVFAAGGDSKKLAEIEKLLDDIEAGFDQGSPDLIRCRARLLTAQSALEQAAQLWSKLALLYRNINSSQSYGFQWWRAKYYELFCIAGLSQQGSVSVVHTIEVLKNTYRDIPKFWAKKLDELKKKSDKSLAGKL